jgi:hypothetical protein
MQTKGYSDLWQLSKTVRDVRLKEDTYFKMP